MNLGWLFAWAKDNNIIEPRDGSERINVRKLLDMYGPAEVAFVRQTLRVRREQARRTGTREMLIPVSDSMRQTRRHARE